MSKRESRASRASIVTERAAALVQASEWFSVGNLLGIGRQGGWSRALAGALVAAVCAPVLAGPEGAQVVRGQVNISRNGAETLIRAGNNSIINYRSFNIASNETVRFVQPGASSRVLNRITTASPTRIDGSLIANGRVYIVNPAGIVFGNGARVNVSGLYAAAGSLSNSDFLAGRNNFTNLRGDVVNQATITADFAGLIGRRVFNSGTIVAPQGTVVMASGTDVLVGERRGNIFVRLSAGTSVGGTGVENSGMIDAAGGRVMLGAGDMYALAVKTTGSVRAKDIQVDAGGGAALVSGTLDASNQGRGRTGGTVDVVGGQISVINARIDASGANGGGKVRIGGDYMGAGDMAHARTTLVDRASSINVNATERGKGGTAVVWSDEHTTFLGSATAKGGSSGGEGGLIETSSHLTVNLSPTLIDAGGGRAGDKGGTWLIDPRNVTISSAANSADLVVVAGPPVTVSPGTTGPDPSDSNVSVTTIQTALNLGTNVTVTTAQPARTDAGNITVLNDITKSGGGNAALTLRAQNNITINPGVTISSSTNALSVVLEANSGAGDTASGTGSVLIDGTITTNGGSFSSSGVGYAQNGVVTTAGGAVSVTHTGAAALNSTISSGAGAVDITGTAISLNGAISTSAGSVGLHGPVTLTGASTIDTTVTAAGGANIGFDSTLGGANTLGLSAGTGGDITFTGAVGTVGTPLGALTVNNARNVSGTTLNAASYTQSAGTGTTAFTGAVATSTSGFAFTGVALTLGSTVSSAGGLLVTNTGLFTLSGAATLANALVQSGGGTMSLGANVTTTSGNISIADALTITSGVTLNAGSQTIAFGAGANMGTNNVSLFADSINFTGGADSVQGTGDLTLSPPLSATSIGVGTGAAGTLLLDNADLLALRDGFSRIIIGNGAHAITVNASTFRDPVVFNAPGAGGAVTFNGQVTGGASASVTVNAANTTALNANIVTAGGAIQINTPVTLGANVLLDTTNTGGTAAGANIGITGAVNATVAETLTFRAGTGGDITLPSLVGSGTRLGALNITSARNATFSANTFAGTVTQSAGTGTTTFTGQLNTNGGAGISLTGAAFTLSGGVVTTNNGTFSVNNSGTLTLGSTTSALDGAFTQTGAGSVVLSGALTTTGDVVSFAAPVRIAVGGASINTTSNDIIFSSTLNGTAAGAQALTLGAGAAGNITFTGIVGGTTPMGLVTISSANNVSAPLAFTASGVVQSAGAGTTTFGGPLTATATSVSLTGTNFTLDDVTTSASSSAAQLFISATGATRLLGSVDLGGAFVQGGGGTLSLEAVGAERVIATNRGDNDNTNNFISIAGATSLVGGGGYSFNARGSRVVFSGGATFGANAITMTGSEMNFSGSNLTGTSTLTLTPNTVGAAIAVGGAVNNNADAVLDLTAADISFLGNGFSQIAIGTAGTGAHAITISSVTFVDPVVFNAPSGSIAVGGNLFGNGDSTLTFNGPTIFNTGAVVRTAGNVIQINGAVTMNDNATVDSTNGGAVAAGANIGITGAVNGSGGGGQALLVNAGTGGDIALDSTVGGSTALGNIGLTGDVITVHGVNTTAGGTLTVANAGLFTVSSGAGGAIALDGAFSQTGAGSTVINNTVTTTNDSITFVGDVDVQAAIGGLSAGTATLSFGGALNLNANPFTLSANTMVFGGGADSVTGSNVLTLRGATDTTNIGVGVVLGAGNLDISSTTLNALADGFSRIVIGQTTGTAAVSVGTISFRDPVELQSAAAINVLGTLTGTDNASVTLTGPSNFAGGSAIVTADDMITLTGAVVITSAGTVTLDSGAGGADISITGNVTTANANTGDLVLDAGAAGDITVAGSIGNGAALSSVQFVSGVDISTVGINAGTITQTAGTGISSFGLLEAGSGGIGLTGNEFDLAGGATTTAGGTMTVSNAGELTVGALLALDGAFSQTGAGPVTLNADITTTNDNISFVGPVSAGGTAAALDAGTTGVITIGSSMALGTTDFTFTAGDVVFGGGANSVTGSGNIVLQPGAAGTSIGIGGGAGTFTVTAADFLAFADGFSSLTVGRANGTHVINIGTVAFRDPTTVRAPLGGSITTSGAITGTGNGATTLTSAGIVTIGGTGISGSNTASIILNSGDRVNINAGLTGNNSASVSVTATNRIALGAVVRTEGNSITLTGPIVLSGAGGTLDTTLNAAAGGNITLAGTVQGTTAGAQAFTLTGGTGDIALGGDIGTTTRLGLLTINSGSVVYGSARTVRTTGATVGGTITGTDNFTLDGGSGNVLLTGAITAAASDLVISGAAITQSGAVSAGTYALRGTDGVAINGNVTATNAGGALLSAGGDGTGNLSFGAGVTVAANAITLSAGNGSGTGSINASTNAPQFRAAAGGATSPAIFQFRQDAAIAGANLPAAAQFGGGLGGINYIINARNGTLTLDAAAAPKVAGGALTLTGSGGIIVNNDLSVASLRANSGITYDSVVVSATGDILNNSTTAITGPVTLRSRDLEFAGNVTPGVGATLTVESATDSGDIFLGGTGMEGVNALHLTNAELARLGNGFGSITIGRADSTGTVSVETAATFIDPVTLLASPTDGAIRIGAVLRGTGDATITLNAATSTLLAGITTQAQDITVNGGIVLASDVTIDATDAGGVGFEGGAGIALSGPIDADDAANNRALTLLGGDAGAINLGDTGLNQRLGSVAANADFILLSSVQTRGAQTYTGSVEIEGDLNSSVGGAIAIMGDLVLNDNTSIQTAGLAASDDIVVTGTIDSGAMTSSLSLDAGLGNVTVGGAIGSISPLANLIINSAGTSVQSVVTTGSQTFTGETMLEGDITGAVIVFNNHVVLNQDTTLTGTTSVSLGSVDSEANEANDLAIVSPLTTLGGSIGAASGGLLGTLTTSGGQVTIAAAQIRTAGAQQYGGAVRLDANTTLGSNSGGVRFASTLNSLNGSRSLTVNTGGNGDTTFGGVVGGLLPLGTIVTNADGRVIFNGNVSTSGPQTYNDTAVLAANTTLTGAGIVFASTVDADGTPRSLTIASAGNAVSIAGAVGAGSPLSSLTATGSTINLVNVTTLGAQGYTGDVTLNGMLIATDSGSIDITGQLFVASDSTITSGGAAAEGISVNGAINSTGGSNALTLNAGAGTVNLLGNVGTTAELGSLTATGGSIVVQRVATVGSQTYNGDLATGQNLSTSGPGSISISGNLALGGNITVSTAGGNINYNTINGANALVTTAGGGGTSIFGGIVGGNVRLTSLTANGAARINSTGVATTGDQLYNGTVVLGSATTIDAGNITFNSTLDSDALNTARAITLNSSSTGDTVFRAVVGGIAPLDSITTNAGGNTKIGTRITTVRGMTFGDLVKITANSTLDGGTGSLFFRQALDADASATDPTLALISNAAADADVTPFRFGGNVGVTRQLGGINFGPTRNNARGATIVLSDGFRADGTIDATAFSANDTFIIKTGSGGFTMQEGQKLTAFGSLAIITSGIARIGDLTALNNLTVAANGIEIQRREGGQVLIVRDGNLVTINDPGVDFVAPNSIEFVDGSGATINGNGSVSVNTGRRIVPTVVGTNGAQPTFSNNQGLAAPNLRTFGFRQFLQGITVLAFNDPRAGRAGNLLPLELSGQGPSITNTATTIAGAIPRDTETREVATPVTVGRALQDPLREMGVPATELSVDELIQFMVGRSLYLDLPLTAQPDSGGYRVTVNRLSTPPVEAAVSAYRELKYVTALDENGEVQLDQNGKPVLVDRSETIKETLGEAWDAYSSQTDEADGAGFRAYLEARSSSGTKAEQDALVYLNKIQDVLMRLDALGLSTFETSRPKLKLLGEVRPVTIPEDQFQIAVNGAPMSLR